MAKSEFHNLHERLHALTHKGVKVGVFAGAGEAQDGTPLVEIAAVHEYGTSENAPIHIPQRSFIRSTFHRTAKAKQELCARLFKMVTNKGADAELVLGLLGQWAVARVKETIVRKLTEGPEPQVLKPSTIAAKGSSTPLIDTGALKNAVTYEITEVKAE